jgi:hypothetical protein
MEFLEMMPNCLPKKLPIPVPIELFVVWFVILISPILISSFNLFLSFPLASLS